MKCRTDRGVTESAQLLLRRVYEESKYPHGSERIFEVRNYHLRNLRDLRMSLFVSSTANSSADCADYADDKFGLKDPTTAVGRISDFSHSLCPVGGIKGIFY